MVNYLNYDINGTVIRYLQNEILFNHLWFSVTEFCRVNISVCLLVHTVVHFAFDQKDSCKRCMKYLKIIFFFFLIHDNIIFMSTMSNWYNCTVFGWVIYRRSKLFIIHNYIKIHGNNKFTSKFILTLWLTHKSNKAEEEKREKREEKKKRRESLSYATSTYRRHRSSAFLSFL